MPSVNVSIDVPEFPEVAFDDDVIQSWIEARLNDARNTFIMRVSRGGGSGREYRRGSRTHRASAPGEYPATDTGLLVNATYFYLDGPRSGTLYNDIEYAKFLTTGTARMAARMMLADALQEVLSSRPRTDLLARAARFE